MKPTEKDRERALEIVMTLPNEATLGDRTRLGEAIAQALADERERCAKVLENGSFLHSESPAAQWARSAAAAIRKGD